jgi:hypothetical protein
MGIPLKTRKRDSSERSGERGLGKAKELLWSFNPTAWIVATEEEELSRALGFQSALHIHRRKYMILCTSNCVY